MIDGPMSSANSRNAEGRGSIGGLTLRRQSNHLFREQPS